MGFTSRRDFSGGWSPDSDAVNAAPNKYLRGDNLILDEYNVLALRRGSSKINATALADLDVHSLFTTYISGTRYRMYGANAAVYANGSVIQSGMTGSGDIPFGFHNSQILFARGTTKKKYDGTTVRNWGIAMTGGKPVPTEDAADTKMLFAGTAADGFTADEGTIQGYGTFGGHDLMGIETLSTPNFRGIFTKTFATPQDFTTMYAAGTRGSDEDIVSWYLAVGFPLTSIRGFAIQVDVNQGTFADDYFMSPVFDGQIKTGTTIDPNAAEEIPGGGAMGAAARAAFTKAFQIGISAGVTTVGFPSGSVSSGIASVVSPFRMSLKRGDFTRLGKLTNGKGWDTVKAVRIILVGRNDVPLAKYSVSVGECRLTSAELLGEVEWKYIYVRNAAGYQAKSAPSPASDIAIFSTNSATVTVPGDGSRDSQVNEIWLYRKDSKMDQFYRSKVKTGVSGTGAVNIVDNLSSDDVLTINIKLEVDNVVPPDNIIGIVGPHFDRTIVLTSDGKLWPSRRLNPDSFATGQVIAVGGVDETAQWVFRALTDVYVGTTKDIYQLDGTGGENPDGSIDYILRPLSMDHRPLNPGVTHEGNQIAFFSDDGWRAMQGAGSTLLTAETSLLYRGQVRHGVGPVNMTGRVRAALAKGQLVAITPEGLSGSVSCVLYRYVFARGIWYRHTYGTANWLSLHREPDGTLIAGDDAGFVWVLDTGTQDDGNEIAVTLWSKVDDLDHPYQRKKIGDLTWRSESGGAPETIAVHINGSSTAATTVTAAQVGMGSAAFDLGNIGSLYAIAICKQIQFRLTGNFSAFHLYDFGVQFRERPIPIIGRVVDNVGGSQGVKVLSGLMLKGNTFGVARTITVFLDGVADPETFSLTTAAEEPETHTLQFSRDARRATDIGFAVNGELEIDAWSPIVSQRQPVGVLVWDSGPIDLQNNGELTWLRTMILKVRAGGDLVITPHFDGVAFPTVTVPVPVAGLDRQITVPVGRAYVGHQPRLTVTSCAPFYPYWVRCYRRVTGTGSQKPAVTVPFTLQAGAGG